MITDRKVFVTLLLLLVLVIVFIAGTIHYENTHPSKIQYQCGPKFHVAQVTNYTFLVDAFVSYRAMTDNEILNYCIGE